jgi:hypothetical protein
LCAGIAYHGINQLWLEPGKIVTWRSALGALKIHDFSWLMMLALTLRVAIAVRVLGQMDHG